MGVCFLSVITCSAKWCSEGGIQMSDQTNTVKSTITRVFLIAVCIIMYIQIVSGIIWIVANIGNVPPFGD